MLSIQIRGLLRWGCALLASLALAGCASAPPAPTTRADLGTGPTHIQVFANADWRDTGVRVQQGLKYHITAEGQWTMGGICGFNDASGAGISPFCSLDLWGLGVSPGALLGRIGLDGKMFAVGTALDLTAPADGVLYLASYDALRFDNSGSLDVTIALVSTTPRTPAFTIQAAAPSAPAASVVRPPADAAGSPALRPSAHGGAGHRVALVIGNGAYREVPPLTNPVNDARLISATLQGIGFEVIEVFDADQATMKRAIQTFGGRLEQYGRDGVGLFYYAGHGVQAGGRNYLIPVTAHIERESDLEIEAVAADWVLSQMDYARSRLNLVILDACRNNPFGRGFRAVVRGLARMDAPTGTLIAYSTAPGDVAADGNGRNSPYSESLARAMMVDGIPVEQTFKQVRLSVREVTHDAQTPWEASSLTGDFFFVPRP